MKKIYITLSIILIGLITFSQAMAQSGIISAKDAAKIMANDNVIVISARTPADYEKVHLPGAINIDHKELYGEKSMLLPANQLATILGKKGIDSNKTLLIYDDGSGKYAGRLYWIFDYLGVTDVRVIDGGMKAWRLERKPVTKNPTTIAAATFTAKPNDQLIATMAEVKAAVNNPNAVIIDARSADEFNGVATTALRTGHIPSAVNLEYTQIVNEQGMLKTAEELNTLFASIGVSKNKTVIVYCESSVRAGIVYLALKELGYPKVAVYDGAYLEWQSISTNSVAMK